MLIFVTRKANSEELATNLKTRDFKGERDPPQQSIQHTQFDVNCVFKDTVSGNKEFSWDPMKLCLVEIWRQWQDLGKIFLLRKRTSFLLTLVFVSLLAVAFVGLISWESRTKLFNNTPNCIQRQSTTRVVEHYIF